MDYDEMKVYPCDYGYCPYGVKDAAQCECFCSIPKVTFHYNKDECEEFNALGDKEAIDECI